MGGWILANQANKRGSASLPGAVALLALLVAIVGSIAAAVHFPGAGWNVPTFAVAALPSLALGAAVSGLGARS
jgi:hypothetical protein